MSVIRTVCGDLEIILRNEIRHVRVGSRWYEYFCAQCGLDPVEGFQKLLRGYGASKPSPAVS
jgi:uncharacterized ferritin-like protein (DUF455 family)